MTRFVNAAAALALLTACTANGPDNSNTVQMSEPSENTAAMPAETMTQDMPSPSRLDAQFIEIEAFKSAFVQSRNISIWLPDGYLPHGGERYPVIYAHDGQAMLHEGHSGDNGKSWRLDETAREMMQNGDIPPLSSAFGTRINAGRNTPRKKSSRPSTRAAALNGSATRFQNSRATPI